MPSVSISRRRFLSLAVAGGALLSGAESGLRLTVEYFRGLAAAVV